MNRSITSLLRHISSSTPRRNTRYISPCVGLTQATWTSLPDIRTYASKAKSTADLVPGSQQRLSSEEARKEYSQAEEKMRAAVDWFRRECSAAEMRVNGRVTSALLDRVRVTLPGDTASVPLEEVASVSVKDATTLVVSVFENHTFKHVESAIYKAKLPHISPQRLDDHTLRIVVAKPTMETRASLVATVQHQAEDTRIQVRKIQQASVKRGKFVKHSIELKEFQNLTNRSVADIDELLAQLKKAMGLR